MIVNPQAAFGILLLFLFLFFPGELRADSNRAFVVSVIDSFPFAYQEENGKLTGTHYEYLLAISDKTGIPIQIKITPRVRIVKNLEAGKTDAVIMFRSAKRNSIVEYAGKVRDIRIIALGRKGFKLQKHEDLYKSNKIGILKNQWVSLEFNGDENLNLRAYNSYPQLIRMLSLERLDTVVGNAIALSNSLRKLNLLDAVELPGLPLAVKQQWFQFSKRSKHLDKKELVQETINELRKDGTFDTILTKHVGSDWKELNK